ncbi:MAG: hypothetical protein HY235_16980 [Acidobacteria bacterium]|nr:hypothetical protein [Acidobacteriota bacterium]
MIETESKPRRDQRREADDPVLLMLGVGKQLWAQESGDSFVERLRSEGAPPVIQQPENPEQSLPEAVWRRIESHQGDEFHTARGLPFTYQVEGAGIWFFRDGRRINRKLTRTQVEVAISRCPLTSTTEIKDLMDYAYLFALLMDPRIRSESW